MIQRELLKRVIVPASGSLACHVPAPVFVTTAYAQMKAFVMNFHVRPAGTSIVPLTW